MKPDRQTFPYVSCYRLGQENKGTWNIPNVLFAAAYRSGQNERDAKVIKEKDIYGL